MDTFSRFFLSLLIVLPVLYVLATVLPAILMIPIGFAFGRAAVPWVIKGGL